MRKAERLSIYTAFTILAALNVIFLLSSSGRTAFAEAAAFLADLGPADSVKLVDGDKELALRHKKGRMAWGDGDFKQTYSVGFVHIAKILNQLLANEEFAEERQRLSDELQKAEEDYQSKLTAIREKLESMQRDTPEFQQAFEEGGKLYQEYMTWSQMAIGRRNEIDVQQLEKSYRELSSAVDVVADKLGIDIVYRFIPTESDFKAQDAQQALEEVRLRTAIKYPAALDITSEVLEELSLEDKD